MIENNLFNKEIRRISEIFIEPRRLDLKGHYFTIINKDWKVWHIVWYYEIKDNLIIIEQLNLDLPKLIFDINWYKYFRKNDKFYMIYRE